MIRIDSRFFVAMIGISVSLVIGCSSARIAKDENRYGLTQLQLEQLLGSGKIEVRDKLHAAGYGETDEVAIEPPLDASYFDNKTKGIVIEPIDPAGIRSALYCEKRVPIGLMAHYLISTDLFFGESDTLVAVVSTLDSYGP